MPYFTRNVLARKFRQNWLNKCSDVKYSLFIEKEIDDSLTNLSWLSNISLNKLTSQSMPLSPTTESSLEYNKYLDVNQTLSQDGSSFTDFVCTWDQLDNSTKQFYKTHSSGRPPFSQLSIICMALQDLSQSRVTMSQICEWINANFPFFHLLETSWQDSVKNLLAISKCFQKVPRRKDEPEKGGYWRLSVDFQKHLLQSSFTSHNKSTYRASLKSVHSTQKYFECYGSSSQYLSDSGHNSSLSSCLKKHTKSNNNNINISKCDPTSSDQHHYNYHNTSKRNKTKYYSSYRKSRGRSSYLQFQEHLTSAFLHEYSDKSTICTPKHFYMNPAAISTPIESNLKLSSTFTQYPYQPINGRSTTKSVLNKNTHYPMTNNGSRRLNLSAQHLSSLYYPKSSSDSAYGSGTSCSSLQQSRNSAFSSFRNLVHKRSYQFSVQSPSTHQLSQFSNTFSFLDHFEKNNCNKLVKSNEEYYRCFGNIDSSNISIAYSSSDQLLISPESIKNEPSIHDSPDLGLHEPSEVDLNIIKNEAVIECCDWWNPSEFYQTSSSPLQCCEKMEPIVSSLFTELDKDQQWVEEELNLDELDIIFGLS